MQHEVSVKLDFDTVRLSVDSFISDHKAFFVVLTLQFELGMRKRGIFRESSCGQNECIGMI